MRDVLIRPNHHHAPRLPVDAAHRKYVVTALEVGAEHLFVVVQAVSSLAGQKQRGHGLDGELAMRLLEDRPDVDHRVDVLAGTREFPHGRVRIVGEKIAQPADG